MGGAGDGVQGGGATEQTSLGGDPRTDSDGASDAATERPGKKARPQRPPSMGIFLSYRREDSAGHAGRLYENLTKRFGVGSVFRDIDTLPAGSDFVEMIGAAVRGADVALVIIGPRWLTANGPEGRRRIDDPNDFVRNEVEAALTEARWIIPVLVGGARMPAESELPPSLANLARRNAVELTDLRWSRDVRDLMATLARSRGPVRRIVDSYHRVEDTVHRLTRPRVLIPVAALALAIFIIVEVTGGGGGTSSASKLTSLLPSSFSSGCKVVDGDQYLYPSLGATASAECTLTGSGEPSTIDYALFPSQSDLNTSFQTWINNFHGSDLGTYSHGAVSGEYGVGPTQMGSFLVFSASQPLVLGVAETTEAVNLQTWFQEGAGDPSP